MGHILALTPNKSLISFCGTTNTLNPDSHKPGRIVLPGFSNPVGKEPGPFPDDAKPVADWKVESGKDSLDYPAIRVWDTLPRARPEV